MFANLPVVLVTVYALTCLIALFGLRRETDRHGLRGAALGSLIVTPLCAIAEKLGAALGLTSAPTSLNGIALSALIAGVVTAVLIADSRRADGSSF